MLLYTKRFISICVRTRLPFVIARLPLQFHSNGIRKRKSERPLDLFVARLYDFFGYLWISLFMQLTNIIDIDIANPLAFLKKKDKYRGKEMLFVIISSLFS